MQLTSEDNMERFQLLISNNARYGCPHHVGRKGKIIEHLHSATYDYAVSDETGDITYFKEHELTPLKGGLTYV